MIKMKIMKKKFMKSKMKQKKENPKIKNLVKNTKTSKKFQNWK